MTAQIEMTAGDDFDFEFPVLKVDGEPQDLTGATYVVQAKARPGDPALFSGSASSPAPATGVVKVTIPASATATGYTRHERLWLEVQMTLATKKRTVFKRALLIAPQIVEA